MIAVEHLNKISAKRRKAILERSMVDFSATMDRTREILTELRQNPKKELLREYGPLKKNLQLKDFLVSPAEIKKAMDAVPKKIMKALETAAKNIKAFHLAQLEKPMWFNEFAPGLLAGRITRPLERVGVYVPGGRASYPSSALMNIIPAKAAGVSEIIAASPPGADFTIRPEILAACALAGADKIYKLGGAWAVGSLAYGLAGLPKVNKIVGPGSSWVTAAKMSVFGQVDIDMPAGPSEGFIICDRTAPASWLAWDLITQLEHDPQAAAVLVTCDEKLAQEVAQEINKVLAQIKRREIILESMEKGGAIIVAQDLKAAFDFSNEYAPEHLQLILENPMEHLLKVKSAGSIFLGPYAPIPMGDYATGPNHVLPTGGAAHMFSGLSVDTFLKKMTFQHLDQRAMKDLGPTVSTLARAEGLFAHAEAVEARLKHLKA